MRFVPRSVGRLMSFRGATVGGGTPLTVIANVGTHPELMHIGLALAEDGVRVVYVTSARWSAGSWQARVGRALPGRLRRVLAVREVPRSESLEVRTVGLLHEVIFMMGSRVHVLPTARIEAWRNRHFRRASGRVVQSLGSRVVMLICQQTNARGIFAVGRPDTFKVLNYPIAHHRWSERLFEAEARRNPEWAEFLQGAEMSQQELARLDDEVAAADLVLVASSFVRRTFVECGADAAAVVAVPLAAPQPRQQESLQPEPGRLRLLFAGQVNQRKGVSYLLDALDALPSGSFAARWAGPVSPAMRLRLLERGHKDVLGAMSQAALQEQMRWADVVVLPSLIEGFGLTALEAMANGRVVVVSDHTFADDIVEHGTNGFVVRVADRRTLTDVLRFCVDHPEELAAIGKRARVTASALTWDVFGARVRDVLTVRAPRRLRP